MPSAMISRGITTRPLLFLAFLALLPFSSSHSEHDEHPNHRHSTPGSGRGWACAHDSVTQPSVVLSPQEYPSNYGTLDPVTGRRQTVAPVPVWQPIRIKIFNYMKDAMSKEKIDYVMQLVDKSVEFFSSELKVVPVSGPLYVERPCAIQWISGPKKGLCSDAGPITCGAMRNIPEEHLNGLVLHTTTNNGKTWEVNTLPKGTGVEGFDLIMYITASSGTDEGDGCKAGTSTLAYSGTCQRDQNDRPVVGYVNFCTSKVSPTTNADLLWEDRVLAAHEMTHVIGFSMLSFPLFRKPSGEPYSARCPEAEGCTADDMKGYPPGYNSKTLSSTEVLITSTERGGVVSRLVTPSVKAVAQLHYGCPTLLGAELENFGGVSTAGSHWEKRSLRTEYMTGSSDRGFTSVYSAFTLALLQDSGWYQVAWEKADAMLWGRGQGCAFPTSRCISPEAGVLKGFCNASVSDVAGCTYDRNYLGECGVGRFSADLETKYQYFPGRPDVGGRDSLADHCPTIMPYVNKRCDNTTSTPVQVSDCNGKDCFGSSFGPTSRCMQTSLLLNDYRVRGNAGASCYAHRCDDGHLMVKLPTGVYHNCSVSSTATVSGYSGVLFCPPTDELCFDQRVFIAKIVSNAVVQQASPSGAFSGSTVNTASSRTSRTSIWAVVFLAIFIAWLSD